MAFEITIPRLGWSMEEGIFAGWQKKDGETIRRGEILFELEGEKALQEIEALDEGVLSIPPDGPKSGSVLKVGTVVGYLLTPGESPRDSTMIVTAPGDPSPREKELVSTAPPSVRRLARRLNVDLSMVEGTGSGGRITDVDVTAASARQHIPVMGGNDSEAALVATPRARRTAKRLKIELVQVAGSGRGGRIRERDVRQAATLASPSKDVSGQRIPVSGRRRIIAERLSDSARQTVPVTITTRADATNLLGLRTQFKAAGEKTIPAIHDIVARLVGESLCQWPILAGRWDGDAIVLPGADQIHIGLAVDTPEGLIVPVLRHVTTHSLISLAEESARVIQKARSGRLTSSEMQGAVFTITNLGAFGIDAFTPVINLPETAILGLGAIRQEPVISNDGRIEVRQMMTLSLTFDHRVIDGAPAARFLQSVVIAIGNPAARLIALNS